ncbi:MAG: uroporphyrinogen-III C-methyltransferase [Eubacteriales bacterium]|nr:uroporphyrinogen-III C-methyltransferase [Eubacteriales bacterium]
MELRIGTRKSRLAMIQTEIVKRAVLEHFPEAEIQVVPMSTKGDQLLDRSLTSFGGKGAFTKELETALLGGKIDLAVHSAKDMPMELPRGLHMGAVLKREEAGDVLVTLSGIPAGQLPAGSVIGTGSLRRQIQISAMNPGVSTKLLRGNVQTRIEKLRQGQYDGILLAAAGLRRLGLEAEPGLHLEYLDKSRFVPAAGQGFLAVESRCGQWEPVLEAIHSQEAAAELFAEREFLRLLGGGCNAPCGAYCRKEAGGLVMTVMYAGDSRRPRLREDRLSPEPGESWQECAGRLARRLAGQMQYRPVYLVGAGPGDEGLITKKGLECLRQAEVVVYDNLISGSLLNEAPLDAELIYAGKRSGSHHMRQEEISRLLADKARQGKTVVRLKGGDPYVFGRGGEEALALTAEGIPYEVVPGVSSVSSVPAYSGIPVTHRGLASSFHVVTGHESGSKTGTDLDYQVLAREEGTLIFLMGLEKLEQIAGELIRYGKPAGTPAAVIENGTTARQKRAVSDLAHIAEAARAEGLRTPAMIVIGQVAELEKSLSWFGKGPLFGKRVLVTGTRSLAGELEAELEPLGAECLAVSLIESRPVWSEETKAALAEAGDYDWLVFTSSNGVDLFFEMMGRLELDLRRLMRVRFAAIGRKTADTLKKYGFICDFTPEHFSGADLAAEWIPTLKPGERVMLLRAEDGSTVLPKKLKEAGILFRDIPIYRTWVDRRRKEELNRLIVQADYVTVASSSAARALYELLDGNTDFSARLISIGPYTTKAARELGLAVHTDAVEYTAAGIAAVILADLEEDNHGVPVLSPVCEP